MKNSMVQAGIGTNPSLPSDLTSHAIRRMSQRAISREAIEITLRHGMRIEQSGATVYFLGHRNMPSGLSAAETSRLAGTTVVMARDGSIITTFRRQRLPRSIRKRFRR